MPRSASTPTAGWGPKAAWTYFPKQTGTLTVDLRRTGFNGVAPFAHATIVRRHREARSNNNNEPVLKHVFAVRHTIVRNGPNSNVKIRIHVAEAPVRVVVTIPQSDLFSPSATDTRRLGAQVEFKFTPTKT